MIAVIFTDNEGGKYSKLYQEYESNRFDFGIELTRDELRDFKVDLSHHPDIVYKCLFRIDITNWIKIVEVSNDKGIILTDDKLSDTLYEYMPVAKTPEKPKKKPEPVINYEKIEDIKKQFDSLMTGSELALVLNVTKRSIYNFVKAGRLQGIKAGREWLFSKENLDEFIANDKKRAVDKLSKPRNKKAKDEQDQM